ncbi:hypothetical protein GCM10010988_24070 [Cnuibacter physcomitrellae]|nr:hypothetical protein GCM10010988_24070 [Cnuibacter physcomitrellae]
MEATTDSVADAPLPTVIVAAGMLVHPASAAPAERTAASASALLRRRGRPGFGITTPDSNHLRTVIKIAVQRMRRRADEAGARGGSGSAPLRLPA